MEHSAKFVLLACFGFSFAGAAGVTIDDYVVAKTLPQSRQTELVKVAKTFYDFWNTGDVSLLKAVASPHFVDHTLPPGRPQGIDGPAYASKNFRAAVPDLRVEIRKMVIAGDMVTVHMNFTGHFTGQFGSAHGTGQAIDFIATDLLKITGAKITDNWHIEDNLTLLTQMGVASVKQ